MKDLFILMERYYCCYLFNVAKFWIEFRKYNKLSGSIYWLNKSIYEFENFSLIDFINYYFNAGCERKNGNSLASYPINHIQASTGYGSLCRNIFSIASGHQACGSVVAVFELISEKKKTLRESSRRKRITYSKNMIPKVQFNNFKLRTSWKKCLQICFHIILNVSHSFPFCLLFTETVWFHCISLFEVIQKMI